MGHITSIFDSTHNKEMYSTALQTNSVISEIDIKISITWYLLFFPVPSPDSGFTVFTIPFS